MKGIDCDSLEKIKIKVTSSLESLDKKFEKSNEIYNDIIKSYKGEGLNFLNSKLEKQLIEIQTSKSKINNYATIINQIIISYKNQDALMQTNLSRAISNKRGEK